jgi:hypothetical protein
MGAAGANGKAGTGGGAGMGAAGANGKAGTGGGAGSGAPDGGTTSDAGAGDGGTAPTFTMVYNLIMGPTPMVPASSCAGGPCHRDPGSGKGLEHMDMNTKASAYTSAKKYVVVGNPNSSKLYTEINSGAMPEGKPKLPANLIKLVADWIRAGALDN